MSNETDKSYKEKILKLLTELLNDDNTTVSAFIDKVEKVFKKIQKETEEKNKDKLPRLSEKDQEMVVKTVEKVAKSKNAALVIAANEDDEESIDQIVVFGQGHRESIFPLLVLSTIKLLKETHTPLEAFAKTLKEAYEIATETE